MVDRFIGIVGVNWGVRGPLRAIQDAGERVAVVVSRSGRAANSVEALGNLKVSRDPLEAMRKDGIVCIASPWSCHEEHLMLAIRQGSHAVVEAPAAITSAGSKALQRLAKQAAVRIHVNLPSRYLDTARHVRSFRETVARNRRHLFISHRFYVPFDEEADWVPLLLYHSIDFARTMCGRLSVSQAYMEAEEIDTEDVPSWSWPLTLPSRPNRALQVKAIACTLQGEGTTYRLLVRVSRKRKDFEETILCRAGDVKSIVGTKLCREDEHSPWQALETWEGPASNRPVKVWNADGNDLWFTAQLDQWKDILRQGNNPPMERCPCDIDDAIMSQELIEEIVFKALHR